MHISGYYDTLYAAGKVSTGTYFISRWAAKKLILITGENKVVQNDVLCTHIRNLKPKIEKNVYFLSDILTFPRILHENSHIPLQVLYWETGKLEKEQLICFLKGFKSAKVPTIIVDDKNEVKEVYLQLFSKKSYWGRAMYIDCDKFSSRDERLRVVQFKLAMVSKEISEKALDFIVKLPENSIFAVLKLLERLPVSLITLKNLHSYGLFWGDYESFLSDLLFKQSAGAVLKHSLESLDSTKFLVFIKNKLDMICKVKTEEGTDQAIANKLKVLPGYVYEVRKNAKRMGLRTALKRLKLVLTLMKYRSKLGVVGTLLLYW